jgi:DNA-binding NtrC family response regulator
MIPGAVDALRWDRIDARNAADAAEERQRVAGAGKGLIAMSWPTLALIDPDPARRSRVAALLDALGLPCRALPAPPPGSDAAQRSVRLVLCVAEPHPALVAALRSAFERARVLIGSSDPSQQAAVGAFRAGADDFLFLGAGDSELAAVLGAQLDQAPADDQGTDGELVGDSAGMATLRAFIRKLSGSDATVLISGETGTGKERAALLVHRLSRRAKGPLVALNCAAIPEALLEGELFGYERGAFSGAVQAYPGKLKLADGGTLLLDEIGELSPAGQAKVLRALETREVFRLGARTPTRFDVRVIAATNRDLEAEMTAGRFRSDLFYRIAVARLHLPPLRDRRDDIGAIARGLLAEMGAGVRRPPPRIDDAAIACLSRHGWPGNVRELRNALEIALLQGDGMRVRAADLPAFAGASPAVPADAPGPWAEERAALRAALTEARGNKTLAASALNCSRMTLYRRMERCGLVAEPDQAVTLSRRVSHAPSHGV